MTVSPPGQSAPERPRPPRRGRALIVGACVVAVVAVIAASVVKKAGGPGLAPPAASGQLPIGTFSRHHVVITLPTRSASYLGAFAKGVPASYAPIESLTRATGVRPKIALYYSGWNERFRTGFAIQAKDNGAIPFIQMEPSGVNLAAIVAGAYDTYLETFATAVASYGAKTGQGVIIGFGHEMNGYWYSWAYGHTSPQVFVAAWRHIVTVFRQQGADDVTWLWTVNIIDTKGGIPSPGPWWPGGSYVTWVGIDGYYLKRSWTFASLFGPTIKAVRALTIEPILISETGAGPAAGQPAKITNLFAGIHSYGLLGFVWFDADHTQDWRIRTPAAEAAFARGARTFDVPAS